MDQNRKEGSVIQRKESVRCNGIRSQWNYVAFLSPVPYGAMIASLFDGCDCPCSLEDVHTPKGYCCCVFSLCAVVCFLQDLPLSLLMRMAIQLSQRSVHMLVYT